MMVCVAAITVPLLAACSNLAEDLDNKLVTELETRGFTDIAAIDVSAFTNGTEYATYYASAGGCRVFLDFSTLRLPGEELILREKSSKGEEYDFVLPNPTAAKVGELEVFEHCFEDDSQSSSAG